MKRLGGRALILFSETAPRAEASPGASSPGTRTGTFCRVILLSLLFLGMLSPAFADQVRGIVVSEITVPGDAEFEHTAALTIEEMLVVRLEAENPFLTGIRVELRLSNTLKKHFDTFALAVYKNVTPEPNRERRFYEAERAFFQYLPYLNRIYVVVPVRPEEEPQESLPVGTYRLEQPVEAATFPLLVTLVPLAKGVPSSIVDEEFYLTVRPVLQKRGYLRVALQFPAGRQAQPVRLFVDENEITGTSEPLELPAGIHQLRVLSTSFKEASATFAVESGKTTRLEIPLEELTASLKIDAPQGAEIFLDGKRLTASPGSELPVEPGSHLVRVKIGDYSHSKKFTIEPGRHYHLGVIFDIIINEE
jgi:hypothetical protein